MRQDFKKIGFKNYSVNSEGIVKNEKTGRILKTFINSTGYAQIQLGLNEATGKQYAPLVHNLVAKLFIPNPNNYPIVNHKDENKLNNDVSNLEWCDYFYNINYGTANIRKASSLKGNQNAKGGKQRGCKCRFIYIYNNKEYTLKGLSKELGCSKSKITESFRRNLGLVKNGLLTRKAKEEVEALKIGAQQNLLAPRELTEEELDELFKIEDTVKIKYTEEEIRILDEMLNN